MSNHLFKKYKNTVMPHGNNMFQTEFGMVMATICAQPSSKYALQYCKCVLHCCAQFPRIDIPSPELDQNN